MGKYVLAFRGQPDRTAAPEEEQAWGAWFGPVSYTHLTLPTTPYV